MSDIPTPPVTLNLSGTAGTNLVPIASFQTNDQGIQARQSIDLQVSEAGMHAVTVQHARTAMRNRLSSLQTELAAAQAEARKLSESISNVFKNWTADESAALSSFYASFTTPANAHLPGTPEMKYPRLPSLDWDTNKASATFIYSYSQRAAKSGSVVIEVEKVVTKDIPGEAVTLKASLDIATRQIADLNERITKTRKALGNNSELENLARAKIAEQMLERSGNKQLVQSLQQASAENVDNIIDALNA